MKTLNNIVINGNMNFAWAINFAYGKDDVRSQRFKVDRS